MRVRHLPRDDDTCGWIRLLPPRPAPRRLERDERVDWAVVGAGFTGLAAARRLAALAPEARVVVIDAQRAGESASGRNSGFAVDLSASRSGTDTDGPEVYLRKRRLNLAGLALLREAVEGRGIECQWREIGKYHCAADAGNLAEIDAFVRLLEGLGLEHTVLEGDALARRLGTDHYLRGVHTPHAVMVQPAALARGLALTLPQSVTLYEESPVTALQPGREVRIQCGERTVRARNVILATNGFLPGMGVLGRRLLPLTLTASLTRPLTSDERAAIGDPDDWGVLAAHGMGATVRYTVDHRIMMRNTAERWPRLAMSATELEARRAIHLASIRARFPALGALAIEHTWSGVVCMTRNLSPYFGRIAPSIWVSAGYNGSGIARGTIAGSLLVDHALGVGGPLLDDIRALATPTWIPPRPFLDIGVALRMRRARRGLGRDL
ncbi:MAG: FAD-dependent oxidoreductase [Ectothiorhodospiraceae bacterium]|nr:FAD-dependent oxidoreductase [Ectothiorhodospiraceae bacterium]